MSNIDNIIKIRKKYVSKLYEYFFYIQKKEQLSPIIQPFYKTSLSLIETENILWNKYKENQKHLLQFDKEISILNESTGIIDHKRLLEVKELREKLFVKSNETYKEYKNWLLHIQNTETTWFQDTFHIIQKNIKKQKILMSLNSAILKTFPEFQQYCLDWKNKPLQNLDNIRKKTIKIDTDAQAIILYIKDLETFNMDQQYSTDQKIKKISNFCENLNKEIENFFSNSLYQDILEKIKIHNPFITEFITIFKDTSFTSLRNSIRIVTNFNHLEKKISTISFHFQNISAILDKIIEQIQNKKNEIIQKCLTVDQITENTFKEWLLTNYSETFNIQEKINQKRNEFTINETSLECQ